MTQRERREPYLWWSFGETFRDIHVRWVNGTGHVRVWWGDDGATDIVPLNGMVTHRYGSEGAFFIRLRQTGGSQPVLAQQQIVIRNGRPPVLVENDPDDPTALVAHFPALDETGIVPSYRIYWEWPGNPLIYDDMLGIPNESFTRRGLKAGPDKIRIIDHTTKWWVEHDIDVPGHSIEFTLAATDRNATLTVDKSTTGKNLVVSWGDGSPVVPVTGNTAKHTYTGAPNTYLVQLAYADATDVTTKPIAITGGSR